MLCSRHQIKVLTRSRVKNAFNSEGYLHDYLRSIINLKIHMQRMTSFTIDSIKSHVYIYVVTKDLQGVMGVLDHHLTSYGVKK